MSLPLTTHVVLAVAMAATAPVLAQQDDAAVRGVIEDQLHAFLRDDAPGAWIHASPGIQSLFRTPEIFMGMVRDGYPPVYRPRSWTFGALRPSPEGPEQEVRIVDAAGDEWIAVYTMQRQPDGTWKISGCRLLKAPPNTA